jgi:hypothetical protein
MIFLMLLLRLHTSLQLQEEERLVKINYSIIGKKNQSGSPKPIPIGRKSYRKLRLVGTVGFGEEDGSRPRRRRSRPPPAR